MMEQRWGLKGENKKKEGSEDGPRKSQEEGTLLSAFY